MSKVQFRYDGFMRWGCVLVFLFAACTKKNEAAFCAEGTCRDPNFPFCDVTGFVSGEEGTCIAVTCTPGEFGECRGDNEVRCNGAGVNYDVVECERGCDAAADGCRLCNPNETACTNGTVATCDANGTLVSSTSCPLGCFEDQPRCRQLAPSNGLAAYADMVPMPPDVELQDATFSTAAGSFTDVSGAFAVPNFLIPAGPQGPAIRVLVVDDLRIQKLIVDTAPDYTPGPALAIVARGEIVITGLLQINGSVGSFDTSSCRGGHGYYYGDCMDVVSGAGGGAHATNGAKGGDVVSPAKAGGGGGIAVGTATLVPLRGGCSGGGTDGPVGNYNSDGLGGGAVQLASATRIRIDGVVDVRGQDGASDRYGQEAGYFITGGGAGGGILLEAPHVELDVNGQLLASGGGGSAMCSTTTSYCGTSGPGAHAGAAALPGDNAAGCDGIHVVHAGGGGGGLGRIRINTPDGTYSKANTSVEDGSLTTGTIATR